MDETTLRTEWHSLAARIDALHDEAWKIQTVQNERMTEIWLEVRRCRMRIAEIAAAGISFDGVTVTEVESCSFCGMDGCGSCLTPEEVAAMREP